MPPHISSMDSNSLMNPYRNAGRSGRNDRAQGEALALQIALATSVGGGDGGDGDQRRAGLRAPSCATGAGNFFPYGETDEFRAEILGYAHSIRDRGSYRVGRSSRLGTSSRAALPAIHFSMSLVVFY
jgi:hypothetical protein